MHNHKIAYITTCKGRLAHLAQTLPIVAMQANAEVEIIVVDYGCPDGTADWVGRNYPSVKVVSVTDDPLFNIAKARNHGAANTKAEWLAFFDADIMLKANFFKSVIPVLKHGFYHLAGRNDPNTWGSCIVERTAFTDIGGYDEAIDGYGGEDNDLYEMLAIQGVRRDWFPGDAVDPIRHSDDDRMQFYSNKNIDRAVRINHLYRLIKADIIRLGQRQLSLKERQQLRKQIADKLAQCAEVKEDVTSILRIAMPERELRTRPTLPINHRPKIQAYLSYELSSYGQENVMAMQTDVAS